MTNAEDGLRMEINWEAVVKERAEQLATANKTIEIMLETLETIAAGGTPDPISGYLSTLGRSDLRQIARDVLEKVRGGMTDIIEKIKPLLEPGSCVPINLDTTINLVQAAAALLAENALFKNQIEAHNNDANRYLLDRTVMLADIRDLRKALNDTIVDFGSNACTTSKAALERVQFLVRTTEKYDER